MKKEPQDFLEKPRTFRDRSKKGRPDPKDTIHPVHEPYEREHFNWKRVAHSMTVDGLGEDDKDE